MSSLFVAASCLSALAERKAYLDPGSGSFIFQLVLAAILGALFVLRSYWTKIKDTVRSLIGSQDEREDDEAH